VTETVPLCICAARVAGPPRAARNSHPHRGRKLAQRYPAEHLDFEVNVSAHFLIESLIFTGGLIQKLFTLEVVLFAKPFV
jgi:hypothetical protein